MNEIVLFSDGDIELEVSVSPESDTVWLTQDQMAALFEKNRTVISRHITNIFSEDELEQDTSVQIMHGSSNNGHRPPQIN
ncbi:hypothetical protein M2150_002608 [Lachnospiraceae bacterium PM6-15]|uniref:death-on-curing protein n=1 Tax=Ohessyouella blattaphilus TaxID=2949333 RepID=UPI003E1A380E